MMEIGEIAISGLKPDVLLISSLVILVTYLMLKLAKRYLFMFIKSEIWSQKIERSWVRIELGVWLFVFFVILIYLLNNSFMVTMVVLLLIFAIGGRYWRDVLNGVVLKFENQISIGDFLYNDDYSGVVVEMSLRGLRVRLKSGDIAFVAYSSFNDFKVRKMNNDLKSEMCAVTLRIKPEITVESAIKLLKKEVMLIPYTLLTYPVKVEVIKLDEKGTLLNVMVHTLNPESAKLVEMSLMKSLKEEDVLAENQ